MSTPVTKGKYGFAITAFLSVCVLASCVSAFDYTKKHLDPLAATAPDIAGLVMGYARHHPQKATELDDVELVREAAAFRDAMTPEPDNYLDPYKHVLVRGTISGIILVCTKKGDRALFEDARCTDALDRAYYANNEKPACVFSIEVEKVCPVR